MKIISPTACALIVGLLLTTASASSLARAHRATTFECETENGELVGCLSLPYESPEGRIDHQERAMKAVGSNQNSLLVTPELSGGAAPSLAALPPHGSGRRAVNTAMLSALQTEEQVRRVEIFLKSSAAAHGDLRVVETQVPPKN